MGMNLGDKLGHYEIVAAIGKGGMGEVYRAHDSRVGRDVAVKVSEQRFGERFEREARAIASLNHPNICMLFDVGPNYLVMELVEGQTLWERIKEGAIPLEESLNIARQIADALEAAHEKGIVHRDLKPGNVIVKEDGSVKVLDFGLAKVAPTSRSASDNDNPELSPTISMAATQAGVILGTAAYMAPEQARGKPVDKRADIWAFGVVLYEMVTGEKLFKGEDLTETLAAVVMKDPDLSSAPLELRPLLAKCLEKDPRKRLRDISGVDALLEVGRKEAQLAESQLQAKALPTAEARRSWLWPVVAGVLAAGVAVALWAPWSTEPAPPEVVRFEVPIPENLRMTNAPPQLSPDGRFLSFVAESNGQAQVWIRPLDTLEARPLAGTESVVGAANWSPDSRSIVFSSGTPPKLKRVDIEGDLPQTLCDSGGGAWGSLGVIVTYASGVLGRVSENGGECTALVTIDAAQGDSDVGFAYFLPDGEHFLYKRTSTQPARNGIYVGSINAEPGQQDLTILMPTSSAALYAPSPNTGQNSGAGYILFSEDSTLMARPFDPDRRAFTGPAVPLAANIGSRTGSYAVSDNGTLAYRAGAGLTGVLQITVLDRQGQPVATVGGVGNNTEPSFSRDRTRVVVSNKPLSPTDTTDIWLYDLARNAPTRFTFDPANDIYAVWSPDDSYLIFSSDREGGVANLYRKAASNAGNPELLLQSGEPKKPTDWSLDGRFLLFTKADPTTGNDLWYLPLDGPNGAPGEPQPYLATEFDEDWARLSPDGRFVAYSSDASGSREVYVRTFPDPSGGLWTISTGFGLNPHWRGDGRELFYTIRNRMMAVPVTLESTFQFGAPQPLFTMPGGPGSFDVDAGGERFIKAVDTTLGAELPQAPITVVLNWQAALER